MFNLLISLACVYLWKIEKLKQTVTYFGKYRKQSKYNQIKMFNCTPIVNVNLIYCRRICDRTNLSLRNVYFSYEYNLYNNIEKLINLRIRTYSVCF